MSKILVRIRPQSKDSAALTVKSTADQTARFVALAKADYTLQGEDGQPLAKVKIGRLGQDLVLQDAQGQEQVVLEGYYNVCSDAACTWQGLTAESAGPQQGWVTAAGVMPETLAIGQSAVYEWGTLPMASAVATPAAASADKAMSWTWPALGGLVALGLAGGAGGGSGSENSPNGGGSLLIKGLISAGPLLAAGNVLVEVWREGVKSGEATVNADGTFSFNVQNGQSGVYVLRIKDNNGTDANYRSETGAQENLVVELRAAIKVESGVSQVTAIITPLTELATRQMVDGSNPNLVGAGVNVAGINRSVGKLWGLGDLDVTQETPQLTITATGEATGSSNNYGKALALLSGLDEVKGSMAAALDSLSGQLVVSNGVVTWSTSSTTALSDLTAATVRLSASGLSVSDLTSRLPAELVTGDKTAPIVQVNRVTATGETAVGLVKTAPLSVGDVLKVTVGVSEVVLIDGNPTLNLQIGTHNRTAVWNGINGANQIVFQYTVTDQDVSGSQGVRITGWPTEQALPKDGAGNPLVGINNLINKSFSSVLVDGVAPLAPSLSLLADTGPDGTTNNDGLTKDGRLVISGLEAQPGSRWEYSLDDALTWQVGALNSAGSTVDFLGSVSGSFSVRVRQIDAAGNRSPASTALTFSLDTVAPTTPTIDVVSGDNAITLVDAANPILVTGTAAAGAEIKVTWGGVSRTVMASATDGAWSSEFLFSEIPAALNGSIQATVTDAAGNTSSALRNVSVSKSPIINAVTGNSDDLIGAFEKLNGVTLSGLANPGASVQVSWANLTLPGSVQADAAGRWVVFADTRTLGDGDYTITVTEGGRTSSRSVKVDTVNFPLPTIAAVAGDNIVNVSEATAGINITGTAEPGSTVTVQWGTLSKEVTASAAGQWTAAFDPGQIPGQGSQTVRVLAADIAGNTASATRPVLVDTVLPNAPTINVVGTQNVVNAAAKTAGVTVTGDASPSTQVILVWGSVTKTLTTNSSGQWSTTFTASEVPADATATTMRASVSDAVGNTATTGRAVRVDTVVSQPVFEVVATDDAMNANEATAGVTLKGTAEPGASVLVEWRDAPSGGNVLLSRTVTADAVSGAWALPVSASDLPNPSALPGADTSISVVQTDTAGNVSVASTRSVLVDRNSPATAVLNAVATDNTINASEKAAGVLLSGTAEANTAIAVTWGGLTKTITSDSSGVWQTSFTSAELPVDGTTPVQVVVTDAVGNTSAATSVSIGIDTQAPALPTINTVAGNNVINQSEAANAVVLSGTGEVGAYVTINWAGQLKDGTDPAAPIQVGSNGIWQVTYAAGELPVLAGNSSLTVKLTDAAGNVGAVLSHTVRMAISDALLSIDAVSSSDGDVATADENILNATEVLSPVILSGSADPGATVTVNWGTGVVNQVVTANSVGVWALQVAPDKLPSADATVNVTTTNLDGNTQSVTQAVVVDTAAPAAPLINAVAGDDYVDASEAAAGVTISGSALGATQVQLTWGDLFETVDVVSGQWTKTFDPGVVPNTVNTIVGVTAVDLAGNTSMTNTLLVRLDAGVIPA